MPRNSAGTYTLPSGNPVVTGTLIESVWANTTMGDLGATLTDSLDRYGRGGMLAQLKLADGTAAAPAFAFNSEGSTGLFHPSAGVLAMSVLGIEAARMEAAGATYQKAITAADPPTTGAHLTNKTYVDAAISTAVGGGTLYVKRAGDTMTGALILTVGAINGFRNYSGSLTIGQSYALGRTTNEAYFGIAGQASNFTTGDVAGDVTLRSEQRIWLSVGAAGMMKMDLGSGILARYGFQAIGDLTPVVASGIRLGISAGQPNLMWSYMSGAADAKHWDAYAGPGGLNFRALNDANTVAANWMLVNRSGMAIPSVAFPAGNVAIGATGVSLASVKLDVVGTSTTGDTIAIRLFDNTTGGAMQMIRTAPGFLYAGVAGSESWLYSQGASALNLGPDGNAAVKIVTNGSVRATFSGNGLIGLGRVNSFGQKLVEVGGGIMTIGDSEGLRIASETGFISFHNAASTVRTGYIQANVGQGFIYSAENATYHQFNVPAMAGALTINSTGVYNGPGAPSRLVRVGEFAATTTGMAVPGLLMRFGRVAATVGTIGTITFAPAMGAIYSCVAMVEGAQGGGWVFRYINVSATGFTYVWDNFNTVGSGNACFINYYAVGS